MKHFALVTALMAMLVVVTPDAWAAGVRPDDRATHGPAAALAVTPASTATATRPDDRAWRGAGYPATTAQTSIAYRSAGGRGFDWADSAVGAAATGLVVLIATGAGIALRRRRIVAT